MRGDFRIGQARRLKPFVLALGISGMAGMALPFMQGVFNYRLILAGAALGCGVTLSLYLFETLIYERRLRQISVFKAMLIKSLVYALVVSICYLLLNLLASRYVGSSGNVLTFHSVFTFALIASMIISSYVTVSRILGQNELILLILGRYHKPKEEERVVMFVDLAGSTTLAETIGPIRFHQLLNDFFYDLTIPILEHGGEIYKYVGDEVIITWTPRAATRSAHCVDCFFDMQKQLRLNSGRYQEKYGVVPEFRAGLHLGKVVIGEMGDFKKEIAILGDTVNTAARIIAESRTQKKPILISETLRQAIPEKSLARFHFQDLGGIQLRGKAEPLGLFSVEPRAGTEPTGILQKRKRFIFF